MLKTSWASIRLVITNLTKCGARPKMHLASFADHTGKQIDFIFNQRESKILTTKCSYANPDGSIVTNNYIADENGFRSSLAPSNGPLLPLVGKAPKVRISHAPIAGKHNS